MKRLWALIPLVLFLSLVTVLARQLGNGRDPSLLPSALIDRPAPDFDLAALMPDRPGFARADLGGQPAIVNLFASWCVPCHEEHATWMGYQLAGGVPVYGIAYKDPTDAARKFLTDAGDPYKAVGQDQDGRTAIDFGSYGVPETYLIDAAGRVRYRYAGPVTPEVLQREILPRLHLLTPGS